MFIGYWVIGSTKQSRVALKLEPGLYRHREPAVRFAERFSELLTVKTAVFQT